MDLKIPNIAPDVYADGIFLPFKNDSFDLVTSFSVIPYVKNIDQFFDEVYRVLKKNGVGVFSIMNLRGLALHPNVEFPNRFNTSQLHKKLKQHKFISIKYRNPKVVFYSIYFDLTSVYGHAIVKPKK